MYPQLLIGCNAHWMVNFRAALSILKCDLTIEKKKTDG